jgi:hypothetical protein
MGWEEEEEEEEWRSLARSLLGGFASGFVQFAWTAADTATFGVAE